MHTFYKDISAMWNASILIQDLNPVHHVHFLLIWFYGISTFVGYLMPNPFYSYIQFYFKQFSLAKVHSLNVKPFYLTHRYESIKCYHSRLE